MTNSTTFSSAAMDSDPAEEKRLWKVWLDKQPAARRSELDAVLAIPQYELRRWLGTGDHALWYSMASITTHRRLALAEAQAQAQAQTQAQAQSQPSHMVATPRRTRILDPPSPRGHPLPIEPIELTVTTTGLICPAPTSMASSLVELFFRLPSTFPATPNLHDISPLREKFLQSINLRRLATTDGELQRCTRELSREISHMYEASHFKILQDVLPPSKFRLHTQLTYACINCGKNTSSLPVSLAISFKARGADTIDVASEFNEFLTPDPSSCPKCSQPAVMCMQSILNPGDMLTFHVDGRTKVALTIPVNGRAYTLLAAVYELDRAHYGTVWAAGDAMFWYYRDYPDCDAWKSTGKYPYMYATQVTVEELPQRVVGCVLFYQRVRDVMISPLPKRVNNPGRDPRQRGKNPGPERDVEWDSMQSQVRDRTEEEQKEVDAKVPPLKRKPRRYVKNRKM